VAATSTALLRRAEDQLTVAGARLAPERLGAVLDRAHATVLRAEGRLARGSRSALERRSSRLDVLEARVAAVDPVRALARGFSLTRRSDGRLVRSVADVSPGEPIVTVLADGRIESTVTETRRLTETHP
jgi:exodeoxyribonuclease VII large subunit